MDTHRGFTLVELLVVVSLAAVVLGLSAPALMGAAEGMRLSSAANTFLAQLHQARSEAIKRNGPVAVCKSADTATCATGGGWEQGWILFHDRNNNGTREDGEELLNRFAALPAGIRLVGNVQVARHVAFAPTGGTRLPSGAFQAGTLTVCQSSASPTQARQIVINAVGRPRILKAEVASCE